MLDLGHFEKRTIPIFMVFHGLARTNRSKHHEGVPESFWKYHRSKEHKFLRRSCTRIFFSTSKKIIRHRKKIGKKSGKFSEKNLRFFKKSKNKIFIKHVHMKILIFSKIFENFRNFRRKVFSIEKIIFFFGVEFFFRVQLRRKNLCSFDLGYFQNDSGTPTWCLEQFDSAKIAKTIKSRLRSFSKTSRFNNSETYCRAPAEAYPGR